jgi:hypothetical protein
MHLDSSHNNNRPYAEPRRSRFVPILIPIAIAACCSRRPGLSSIDPFTALLHLSSLGCLSLITYSGFDGRQAIISTILRV